MNWWNIIKEPTLSTRAGFTPALSNTTYGKKSPCETCEDKETPCGCKIEKRKYSNRIYLIIDKIMKDGVGRNTKEIIGALYDYRDKIASGGESAGPIPSLRDIPNIIQIGRYLSTNNNYIAVTKRSPKQYEWIGGEE
tara:strand:+ start:187 stop:597 length:411 start_codon:yes stop_codon:yes gene_type:complete